MQPVEVLQSRTNFEAFTNGPIKYLGYITMTMNEKRSMAVKVLHLMLLANSMIFYCMQWAFVGLGCGTLPDRYAAIIFINYYTVALGKHFTMVYFRLKLKRAFEEFKNLSPNISEVRQYGLYGYLKNYKLVERFIYNFFVYICLLYSIQPIVQSFITLWLNGEFGFQWVIFIWPTHRSYLAYGMHAVFNGFSSFIIGFSIVSADVSLLSCLSQLCANFDLIAQRILELEPEKEQSLKKLNGIIQEHQKILKLCKLVNTIFAPSIGFTLFSSSFIICFVSYQMLGDVSLVEVIMAFLLLCYECKQVILICFYGDKLMEMSGRVFDVTYMHEWYNGSLIYRRQIAFLLMCTRRPVAIRIAGNIDVSLITLKQVFSNAYQIFAVLKTA